MLDELNIIKGLLEKFEGHDKVLDNILKNENMDYEKKLKALWTVFSDMNKTAQGLIKRLEELEKEEQSYVIVANRRAKEVREKCQKDYEELEKKLLKTNNARKSIEDKKVRRQRKFMLDENTRGIIDKISVIYTHTAIVEKAIKDCLQDADFNVTYFKPTDGKKKGFVVWIDIDLIIKYEKRCEELGIWNYVFLENALRHTYKEYFNEE